MSVIELVCNYTTYIQIKWSYYRGGLCHPTNPSSGFPHYLLYAHKCHYSLCYFLFPLHMLCDSPPGVCVGGGVFNTSQSSFLTHVNGSVFSLLIRMWMEAPHHEFKEHFLLSFFLFLKTFFLSCHQFSYIYNSSLDSSVFLRECLYYFSTNLLIFHM